MIQPVILCGGSGTRLWPRSRATKPKPFLTLTGRRSLFEKTLDRLKDRQIFDAPLIVTGADHLEHVQAQAGRVDDIRITVEPQGKNTAPAIALAAMGLPEKAIMLVCPSDHHIEDETAFKAAAEMAANLAEQNWLVSFGIAADKPETGYGYIKKGLDLGGGFAVDRFVEKPDRETAEAFLADGGYSWNGGIFAFRAGTYLDALTQHRPDMVDHLRDAVRHGTGENGVFYPDPDHFAGVESESIDYAVMENTDRAAMVPVRMGWSDIGNWDALRDARKRDEDGNTLTGKAELIDCRNVLIESDGPRVSAIGLDDIIIVVDGDDVLVTTADGAQKVGKLTAVSRQGRT
ncbi:MAG: mannose-1-phosphate guanylyltransferase [Pontixanthobacter sp.]